MEKITPLPMMKVNDALFKEQSRYWETEMDRLTGLTPEFMHYLYNNQPNPKLYYKETTKMNIQEKDCRRCEKLDERGQCTKYGLNAADKFPPKIENACPSFTPITGRDCRNCERFNGKDKSCADGMVAASFPLACDQFNELKGESKSSPTVLVYTDEDGEEVRVTKGERILSLNAVWSERPCSGEYRDMSIKFTEVGYNPDSEIHFTQDNLNLLSDPAFQWLLDMNFFIKAEEEKPVYGVGQWFRMRSDHRNLYVLCEGREPQCVLLIRVFGNAKPTQCSPGRWNTIEEAGAAVGHTCWQELEAIDPPIDPPFEV